MMATDGNRLVCGIQRTRCAAPHTRCTLAGAGARDLAHPLLMSRKAIADDRQETRDRPNPRSARPRRWTLWRLAVETHCFCRCAAGAWRFGRSHRPREGRRPGRRRSPGGRHGVVESPSSGGWRPPGRPREVPGASRCRARLRGRRGGAWRAPRRVVNYSEGGRRPRWRRTVCSSSCKHSSQCTKWCGSWFKLRCDQEVRFIVLYMRYVGASGTDPPQRSFKTRTRTYRPPRSTPHDLNR